MVIIMAYGGTPYVGMAPKKVGGKEGEGRREEGRWSVMVTKKL